MDEEVRSVSVDWKSLVDHVPWLIEGEVQIPDSAAAEIREKESITDSTSASSAK
jgi:hypothetical protein